jgi:glycosyltransferase involved in cell wall biosynthesis
MRRYESRACRRADLTIAVSEDDRLLLEQDAPESRMEAIPTGVDVDYFHAGDGALEQAAEIVFTGSMDWHPNEDAMCYFIDAILPLLRREVPGVSLTIVGRNPSPQMRDAAEAAGVTVTGTVDDVRPYIRRAAVYVVPLRIGGGTRLKIYEALAMGKAVVSTTIGAEGLPLEEGVHILRADDPYAFARKILDLLQNPKRRQGLGAAGRRLMEREYSWSRVAQDFERHCRALV